MRLVSWNVNGLRAATRKGFGDWLQGSDVDVVCLQETKLQPEQVPPELSPAPGYQSYWHSAQKKGYSGVGIFSRVPIREVKQGFGHPRFAAEGRTQVAEFDDFTLLNAYMPNGKKDAARLAYKLDYYKALLEWVQARHAEGRPVVICGDVNTAHHPIDLARPKGNVKSSGFLPEERAWLDRFLDAGMVDTFREFNQEPDQYSWWSQRGGARGRNVGWRIDYFYASSLLRENMVGAEIHQDVLGSDHCPISLELKGVS